MVPSGVLERIRKLTKNKVISRYETRIDARKVGLKLVAFVHVSADDRAGNVDAAAELMRLPEVQELHNIAGEDCYLLKVRVADPQALGYLVRDKIRGIKSVLDTKTTIVLDTFKETSAVPLPKEAALRF